MDPTQGNFHDGELAVQQRAGVRDSAARLARLLDPPDLDGGLGRFLGLQRFAVLTAVGVGDLLWSSPLVGSAGFLRGHGDELVVEALPRDGDPLAGLAAGAEVGLVAIDLPARRRIRVNGRVRERHPGGLRIDVAQAYGNCPKYLHPHEADVLAAIGGVRSDGGTLTLPQRARLTSADTVFLGTRHPTRGVDSSHRGGPPGFLTVELDGSVSWPDYPGNDMFNSLGNLTVDPSAALLVPDFATGSALHLSGQARIRWDDPRRVVLTPTRVIEVG